MIKRLHTVMAVGFLFFLLPLLFACRKNTSHAEEASPFLYEIKNETVIILGYSGLETEITIPESIEGYPVTVIAENAFRSMKALTEVVIPDSVLTIDYAFVACEELTKVKIGNGVTSMSGAFRDCIALTTVEGGEHAVHMDESFLNCSSLTAGYIPASAKSCQSTFRGCSSLYSVIVEEGIDIMNLTFSDCGNLRQIHLPSTLTTTYATFENCSLLSTVTGGEGISVYDKTFKNCSSLTSLTLGAEVTKIIDAFTDCIALKTIENLPTEVAVYTASFNGCKALTEIVIPMITDEEALSDYNISEDFESCTAVTRITIHPTVEVREEFCKLFAGCMSLEEVVMPHEMAEGLLRVTVSYTDTLFADSNSELDANINKYKKASTVRTTDNFGIVETIPYTRIYGGDINTVDTDKIIAETSILDFDPFTRTSYWCGYPTGGDRRTQTVGIERTFSFYLRVTGKNDGTIPSSFSVNGMPCTAEG